MKPEIIDKMAELTTSRRLNMEDLEKYKLKIFGDILEALFGAVFIDSGCNLTKTREVFMKLFEPYLYVYGNPNTTMEHPRTEAINFWTK
jgi:dsRNA-specific ribonuclease